MAYERLDLNRSSIRLLSINEDSDGKILPFKVPLYSAPSYVRKDLKFTNNFTVNGRTLAAAINLFAAQEQFQWLLVTKKK